MTAFKMPSWESDEPIELENGAVACRAHQQVICVWCNVDYSFVMEEYNQARLTGFAQERQENQWDYESQNYDDRAETSMNRTQSQRIDDAMFMIPDIYRVDPMSLGLDPSQLFPFQHRRDRQFPRFAHRSNLTDLLIYTDGSCLNNGQAYPAAGWGFVFRNPEAGRPHLGRVSGRLEDYGPSDEAHPETNNRAELRAVIAALQFREWFGEGWSRLVIATDSEYVVRGATEWVRIWTSNDWMTSNGTAVRNRDLWEELLREAIRYHRSGMEIQFWRIPRSWNQEADRAARVGAAQERCQRFARVMGLLQ